MMTDKARFYSKVTDNTVLFEYSKSISDAVEAHLYRIFETDFIARDWHTEGKEIHATITSTADKVLEYRDFQRSLYVSIMKDILPSSDN